MTEAKRKYSVNIVPHGKGKMLVEPVSMGMRSKSVIPAHSNDCTFLFIIPGQVSVIAKFPSHSEI